MDGLTDVTKSKLSTIVSRAAPLLATVLGGPFAGVAVNLIANAFGLDSKNPEGIVDAIQANPESSLKLKTLEYENSVMLAKISAAKYSTEVSDKKDARKYSFFYKDFLRHMAYLVTIGFFCALILLFFPLQLSSESKQLLSMLVGMLVSKWQTIIDFFYGSSRNLQFEETPVQ